MSIPGINDKNIEPIRQGINPGPAKNQPTAKNQAEPEGVPVPSFSAPIFNQKSLKIAQAAPAPQGTQKEAEKKHFALVERNWDLREKIRKKAIAKTLRLMGEALDMLGKESKGLIQKVKEFAFSEARKSYFQVENHLMLDAAEKCINMFYFSRGIETQYLAKAEKYIRRGLANKDTRQCHDIIRFSYDDLFGERSETIFPVEAYFKLKLALFQVYSHIEQKKALAWGKEIETELNNPRVIQAQRSNRVAAQGYLHRLNILRGIAGLYNPFISYQEAFNYAEKAHLWAKEHHTDNTVELSVWGMNKKDLRYDMLNSQIIMGRLLVKMRKYEEARQIFQAALKEPEAVKKYGGFLDIGLTAFFGLVHLAIVTSTSLKEATQKLEEWIPWDLIASEDFMDLRESLGLVIRRENLTASFLEIFGDWALYLDAPSLAPEDSSDIVSELNILDYKPKDKMALLMKLIDYVEIPYDQRSEIIKMYDLLMTREEAE
ncbi:hypothetical protein AMJ44_05795 [candidate division WOR-1 bacterium DG_54_3]|uniref:Uncharacterized protein n=1 Tax=candidate division WOR-1 bacterium DG_54_3 TaxID=1703775 RepID=A0A0S7Y1S1_UNCSA|nr:MAG: hypothetical protein AMJ44_05795 [candidate division WOR-1 bacterium DG_54_3]